MSFQEGLHSWGHVPSDSRCPRTVEAWPSVPLFPQHPFPQCPAVPGDSVTTRRPWANSTGARVTFSSRFLKYLRMNSLLLSPFLLPLFLLPACPSWAGSLPSPPGLRSLGRKVTNSGQEGSPSSEWERGQAGPLGPF